MIQDHRINRYTFLYETTYQVASTSEGLIASSVPLICIVRIEDIDWTVYHIVADRKCCIFEEIVDNCRFDPDTISSSIERLTKYRLIDKRDGSFRVCSIEESIMKQQIKKIIDDPCSDIIIEGGVVKVRPKHDDA